MPNLMPYLKAGLTVERLRISFSHPVLASLAVRKVSHVFLKEFTQPRTSKFHVTDQFRFRLPGSRKETHQISGGAEPEPSGASRYPDLVGGGTRQRSDMCAKTIAL